MTRTRTKKSEGDLSNALPPSRFSGMMHTLSEVSNKRTPDCSGVQCYEYTKGANHFKEASPRKVTHG